MGDCDGDGFVRIHELVRLVDAVFAAVCPIPEGCPVDPCLGLDADRDGVVTGSELVLAINRLHVAVGNGLSGCPTPP